jgi:hypothetical protein
MQRWIIAGVVAFFLLGGGVIFGYWKIKQQTPDHRYIPLPFNSAISPERRVTTAAEFKERLLTDAILTGVARDCDIVSKWHLPSETVAVEKLREKAMVEIGTDKVNEIDTECLRIGFRGVVAEHNDLETLAERLMQDVSRLVEQDAKGSAPAGADSSAGAGAPKF